jgi:hypothetical protein
LEREDDLDELVGVVGVEVEVTLDHDHPCIFACPAGLRQVPGAAPVA